MLWFSMIPKLIISHVLDILKLVEFWSQVSSSLAFVWNLLYLIPPSIINSSSFVTENKPAEGKRFIRMLVKVGFRNHYTLFGC